MLPYDVLIGQIELDKDIKRTDLEHELARTLRLQVKYLRYHREYKEALIKAWRIREKLEIDLHQYYSGSAPSDVYREKPFNLTIKNQTELARWISSDPDMQHYQSNIELTEDCIETVSSMLEELKYRNNHIKTMHDIRVFESGA